MEFATLKAFLLDFVVTPGGGGAILYFVLEKMPYVDQWFAGLSSAAKRLTVLILSLATPLTGMGLAILLGYIPFTENEIYIALQAGFAVFTGSQLVHTAVDLRRK